VLLSNRAIGFAAPFAQVHLPEPVVGLDPYSMGFRDQAGHLEAPRKRAGKRHVDISLSEAVGNQPRLFPPGAVERYVGIPHVPALGVPCRLTMPYQDQPQRSPPS